MRHVGCTKQVVYISRERGRIWNSIEPLPSNLDNWQKHNYWIDAGCSAMCLTRQGTYVVCSS